MVRSQSLLPFREVAKLDCLISLSLIYLERERFLVVVMRAAVHLICAVIVKPFAVDDNGLRLRVDVDHAMSKAGSRPRSHADLDGRSPHAVNCLNNSAYEISAAVRLARRSGRSRGNENRTVTLATANRSGYRWQRLCAHVYTAVYTVHVQVASGLRWPLSILRRSYLERCQVILDESLMQFKV